MGKGDFLYKYKNVEEIESKTMFQKNEMHHNEDIMEAFENFVSEKEVTIIPRDKKAVKFNRSFLIFFSKIIRSCLAANLSCFDDHDVPTIIMPDSSSASLVKVRDILEKRVTMVGVKSYKDVNVVVEAAKLLGINVADLQFDPVVRTNHSNTVSEILHDGLSDECNETNTDDTLEENLPLDDKEEERLVPDPEEYEISDDSDDTDKETDEDIASSDEEADKDDGETVESVKAKINSIMKSMTGENEKSYGEVSNNDIGEISTIYFEDINNTTMDESETSELMDKVLDHKETQEYETNEVNQRTDILDEYTQGVINNLDIHSKREGKLTVLMADPETYIGDSDNQNIPSPLKDEINFPVVKKEPVDVDTGDIAVETSFQKRFRCTICHNIMRKFSASTFKEHYSTAHFHKDIFEMFIKDNSETACRIEGCGKVFGEKNRGNLVRHIGSTHNKSVEILQLKGMDVPMVLMMDNKRKRSDVKFDNKKVKIKTENFECEMCEKYFSTKSNLERHLLNQH